MVPIMETDNGLIIANRLETAYDICSKANKNHIFEITDKGIKCNGKMLYFDNKLLLRDSNGESRWNIIGAELVDLSILSINECVKCKKRKSNF